MAIQILLADDHDVLRESLRRMLESHAGFCVAGEACDGVEAVEMAARTKPDVVVLDIGMKAMNGIDAAARIARLLPGVAILMLTVYSHQSYVSRAIEAGARGYLLKESLEEEELVRAILTLHEGGRFFSPLVAAAARS